MVEEAADNGEVAPGDVHFDGEVLAVRCTNALALWESRLYSVVVPVDGDLRHPGVTPVHAHMDKEREREMVALQRSCKIN